MGNRLDIQGYRALFPAMNQAMLAMDATTVPRAAGVISQFGTESGGLRWFTELGNNCQRYEGRDDLGNDQPGDGCRFKGRGPIQVTGRAHYTNLSRWAYERNLVPSPTFFVDNPDELASNQYGFLGAVWYWNTHKRPDNEDGIAKTCNEYCDEMDIVGLTRCVNGGTHGLEDPWPAGRRALWDAALAMGDDILPSGSIDAGPVKVAISPNPAWRGDPKFLPDALQAFGVTPVEYPGWLDRGHGDFGQISWVLWHHTGNVNETDEGIAHHPALGLAANMLIHPDGKVVLTGVGIAWHGGEGIYPGIPEDAINQVSIGIECAYGPDRNKQFTLPWPDVQVQTMIKVGAAITWFLGLPASHNIAHKEWAGADNPLGINKQGKPDPGNFNMDWFRDRIAEGVAAGPIGEVDDVPTVKRPSGSIYRDNNNNLPWEGTEMDFVIDAQTHEGRVEALAEKGDPTAVELVARIVEGRSPVQDSLSDTDVAHAQAVWDSLPKTKED
jgi:predicted chitinase